MSSFFSFLRPEAEPPGEEPPTELTPGEIPKLPAPEAATAAALTTNSAPALDQVLTDMLAVLNNYLPAPAPPLPAPNVSVTSLAERPLAIGNHRGTERRGPFAVVALKGGRLDAVVRFQLWGNDPDEVNIAIETLHGRLLAARDELWAAGFLRFAAEATSLAEHMATLEAWYKTTNYKILYEFHYQDTDGAESIITRIPIHSDPEERDSLQRETTVVTDEMVRWDNEEAQPLEVTASVRASVRVTGLAILAYLPPSWTGNQITLARLDRESTDPPTTYLTLAEFHTAVTDPVNPDHHAQVTFASPVDFLAEFAPIGDPLELGDWDEDGRPDEYQPGALVFDPPIRLERGDDLIRLSYQDAAFDTPAVVYLRVGIRNISSLDF